MQHPRCAVFVDAGYLLAGGGYLYCNITDRRYIQCDYGGVADAIRQAAQNHCGYPVLRAYWYDAAPGGIPQQDHKRIASLPYVKLRLGRLVEGRQKGVDSLIVRDLMVLARERAIVSAYIFGGDEDLREGVREAQDMGVHVVMMGLRPSTHARAAETLVQEADENVILGDDYLRGFFTAAPPAPVPPPVPPPAPADPVAVGRAFAQSWRQEATEQEILTVVQNPRFLPVDIDRRLLSFAQESAGPLHHQDAFKRAMRTAFVEALAAEVPPAADAE